MNFNLSETKREEDCKVLVLWVKGKIFHRCFLTALYGYFLLS